MTKDIYWIKESYFAHRGIHNNSEGIIENTEDAFKIAIEKKYNIELDVRLTKDKKLVVFHDPDLKRLLASDKKIKDMTYDELKEITIGKNKSKIPLFVDILKLINGKVGLLIEIKSENNVGELEKILIDCLKEYNGKYAIQSFSKDSIFWIKENYPEIIRGLLVGNLKDIKLKKIIGKIKNGTKEGIIVYHGLNCDFISLNVDNASDSRIKRLRKKYVLLGWTVRSLDKRNEIKDKYDNLICEKIL